MNVVMCFENFPFGDVIMRASSLYMRCRERGRVLVHAQVYLCVRNVCTYVRVVSMCLRVCLCICL